MGGFIIDISGLYISVVIYLTASRIPPGRAAGRERERAREREREGERELIRKGAVCVFWDWVPFCQGPGDVFAAQGGHFGPPRVTLGTPGGHF